MEDKRGKRVLDPLLQQIRNKMHAVMGAESEVTGMDPNGFMMDMPLLNIFHFFGDALSTPPEDLVDGLLTQVQESN